MAEFIQEISDRDYKKAIAIHYFGYKYTYINPILGIILLLWLFTTTILVPDEIGGNTFFLFLLACLLLLRPVFYIQNAFKSIKTYKLTSHEMKVQLTEDNKITTTSLGNSTTMNLKDLYAYKNSKGFLFLYASRNQYLILDKKQIPLTVTENLLNSLNKLNINKK